MVQAKSKTVEVEIWTEHYRIIGTVHIPLRGAYKGRLSDFLNRPDAQFLSLTTVTVFEATGQNALWRSNFLALNKANVLLVKALVE